MTQRQRKRHAPPLALVKKEKPMSAATPATQNGNGAPSLPRNPFAAFKAVNLDEMKRPSTLSIPFTERGAAYEVEQDGQTLTRYHEDTIREVKLSTRVPNAIFTEFLQTIYPHITGGGGVVPVWQAMTEAVLLVWQLYEPEMTAERLNYGLGPVEIAKLFADFFSDLLLLVR